VPKFNQVCFTTPESSSKASNATTRRPAAKMDSPLDDELLSINSIYGPATLTLIDPPAARVCTLSLPSSSVILRLQFPEDYPDAPPSVLGTESVGAELRKGLGARTADATREVLGKVYVPGGACMYDLIEEMSRVLDSWLDADAAAAAGGGPAGHAGGPGAAAAPAEAEEEEEASAAASWTVGPRITERKSAFVARAAAASSPAEARAFLRHLLATDRRVAGATHSPVAWRIRGGGGAAVHQDCDDDGETAAGGRLLHLLRVMGCWDVVVVVSRWYGGVRLGPDRFRIINSAARDVLVAGGFASK
jgi:hypothetical protein